MTIYEVEEALKRYKQSKSEAESVLRRIERLKEAGISLQEREKELNDKYRQALLKVDDELGMCLVLINSLDNIDSDVDILMKYHIDGLNEKVIAKQLHLNHDYIRTKRRRAYAKIGKKFKELPN
jgi:hypothetical protein